VESAERHRQFAGGRGKACDSGGRGYSKRTRRPTQRRGVATVEFAVVAPIVFLLILALIQFASLLMNQNVLTAAAREGARIAALPSTVSTGVVVATVEDRLTRGGVDADLVTVNVSPTSLGDLATGDTVTVSVAGPLSSMVWIQAITLPDANLSAQIAYQRE
jgi:Flp pilus assembly protein TadG